MIIDVSNANRVSLRGSTPCRVVFTRISADNWKVAATNCDELPEDDWDDYDVSDFVSDWMNGLDEFATAKVDDTCYFIEV